MDYNKIKNIITRIALPFFLSETIMQHLVRSDRMMGRGKKYAVQVQYAYWKKKRAT